MQLRGHTTEVENGFVFPKSLVAKYRDVTTPIESADINRHNDASIMFYVCWID